MRADRVESKLVDLLFDEPGVGLCLVSPDGRVLRANPAWLRAIGHAEGEVVGRALGDLLPAARQALAQVRGRAGAGRVEIPACRRVIEGREVRWEGSVSPLAMEGGTGLVVVMREVCGALARPPLEGERGGPVPAAGLGAAGPASSFVPEQRAEEQLELFIEHAPAALAMFDREMRYLRASRKWRSDYRLGDRDLYGRSHYEVFPEIGEAWKRVHRRGLAGEVVRAEADPFVRADGSVQWLRWEVRPWRDGSGRIGGIVIFTEDITEVTVAAKKVEEREQWLRLAQEAAGAGTWEWNVRTGENVWSDELWRLYGLEKAACTPSRDAWLEVVVPDDRARAEEAVRRAAHQGTDLAVEFRVRRPDARVRHLLSKGKPLRDETGAVERILGIAIDITERKLVEEALREREERLAVTLRSIGDAVIATDEQGRVTLLNGVAEKLTGWTSAEAAGSRLQEVFRTVNERTRCPVESPVDRVLREGIVVGLADHTALVARDGTERPITDSGAPIRSASGVVSGVVLVFRDQTDERRADEAKALLAGIVESTDDAILSKDLQGTILSWNAAAERLLGYRADEVIGRPGDLIIPPARRGEERFILSRIEKGERVEHFETQRVTKAGDVLEVSVAVSPIRDRDGRIVGASKILRDITDRKRSEAALRQSEARLRALADSMHQLAWTARPDGYITWYNRRWYEYTGTTPARMEGWGWQSVHDPATLPDVLRRWNASIASGMPFEMEFPLRGADGRFRRFLTRGVPLKGEDGAVLQWFGTNTDVTELVEAQEALREQDRRKNEFLGMLSHELRNPLAPIRNSIYVLRHAAPGSEQVRRAQSVIERQTEHLTRLVDDLLDVTRIARGKVELRRSRIDLREVVLRAADDFRVMMDERGIAFELAVTPERMPVEADPTRITQVIGNLLHNSAKFTRPGDAVTLSLRSVEGHAEISVRDTGIGIAPALVPVVFDAFVQGERTLARTEGGLGLGLALVKGITELHGGTVRAESAGTGRGAEFVVRLPLAPSAAPGRQGAGLAARPRRVLVVDDDRDAAESLADVVRTLGHVVEVALDGPSALEKVRAAPPDVVLCDLGLPGMSGFEVARALRAEGRRGIQLIAVSGYSRPEDVKGSVDAGFDAHVAKPCDLARLEQLLG